MTLAGIFGRNHCFRYGFWLRLASTSSLITYVEFQKYNYTLDRFSNLIRESATLLKSKMDGKLFEEMVEADILLYYLSLVYTKTEEVYDMWYPELSIYNFCFTILPKLVSNRYFEKAKILCLE